ncbi:DUF1636 domain-containing protein [Ideonella sp. DXS22W]|uniref:DUF1636 domain-containing protein n=1 Tax=Pseudaquabacterium inlustre TaxID=2984192 RepID=A0ABU9CPA7_9BURK
MSTHPTELLVCTTCRPGDWPREGESAGELLHEAVQLALMDDPQPTLRLRGIACLAACGRGCTAALQAGGKFTYLFGDLPPDGESAAQLLTVAAQHQAQADGQLPWAERPERLKRGLLARLVPLAG